MAYRVVVSAAREVDNFVVAPNASPSNVRVVVAPRVEPDYVLAIARAAEARGFVLEDKERVVGAAVRSLRSQLACNRTRLKEVMNFEAKQRDFEGRFHPQVEIEFLEADIARLRAALRNVPYEMSCFLPDDKQEKNTIESINYSF